MDPQWMRFKCPPILDAHESSGQYWKRWKTEFLEYMANAGFLEESSDLQGKSPGMITEKRKIAILLNLLGNNTLQIFRSFKFVVETDRDDFKAILNKFDEFYSEYYIPRLQSVIERLNYFKYKRGVDFSKHRNAEILSAWTFRPPQTAVSAEESNSEDWKKWKEEFLIFMEASGFLEEAVNDHGIVTAKVSDKRKIAILVELLGQEAQQMYSQMTFTHLSDKYNFYTVLEKFEEHYSPQVNLVKERFKFFSVKQGKGESFANFYKNLRITSVSCDFGDQRDGLMRDRIISKIRDKSVQTRLLERNNISLEEAVELCYAAELAESFQQSALIEVPLLKGISEGLTPGSTRDEGSQISIWSIVAEM